MAAVGNGRSNGRSEAEVTVVGAGVVGLTCALALAEAGVPVRVAARDRLQDTTSSVAAAVWFPYRAYPFDRVLRWSRAGYEAFAGLSDSTPEAGVRMRWGTDLRRDDAPEPWWAGAVPHLGRTSDVPEGYAMGWRFRSPVIDMSHYLPWLESRLAAYGVVPETKELTDLADIGGTLVNCAGLGTRELVPDPSVDPVRGQVVVVEQVGLDEWLVDDSDDAAPIYVVPRLDQIVVGGTAEEGVFDRSVDPGTARRILTRATELVPALAGARELGHKVGLRPGRPTVRLEAEQRDGRTVIHCYGHGGAGVTLSWGCALNVVDLVHAAAT